jgi:DNA replication protein DnaC
MSGHLRIWAARFPQSKSLDTFDFNAQPSLNKALVLELAHCKWIEKCQNCIGPGPSGTGKTHIGLALGMVRDWFASGLNSLIGWALNGRT